MSDISGILAALERGDRHAAAELLPLVYDELRRLAAARLAQEKPGQTLDATGLVHEAYLRLVGGDAGKRWEGRRHFFGAAAEAMRRILIDNARRNQRLRHGGDRRRMDPADFPAPEQSPDDLLALDEALTRLAAEDGPAAEVAKLRLFAGLSVEEAAETLALSRAAGYRHWTYARAWLRDALADDADAKG
jgi:RNA polymerase sigma factor (TIGR02999 family)